MGPLEYGVITVSVLFIIGCLFLNYIVTKKIKEANAAEKKPAK